MAVPHQAELPTWAAWVIAAVLIAIYLGTQAWLRFVLEPRWRREAEARAAYHRERLAYWTKRRRRHEALVQVALRGGPEGEVAKMRLREWRDD